MLSRRVVDISLFPHSCVRLLCILAQIYAIVRHYVYVNPWLLEDQSKTVTPADRRTNSSALWRSNFDRCCRKCAILSRNKCAIYGRKQHTAAFLSRLTPVPSKWTQSGSFSPLQVVVALSKRRGISCRIRSISQLLRLRLDAWNLRWIAATPKPDLEYGGTVLTVTVLISMIVARRVRQARSHASLSLDLACLAGADRRPIWLSAAGKKRRAADLIRTEAIS